MSPFVFDQYRSPYVGSISELMQAPAQAQARAAEQIGNAQANAALQSGGAWANAAQNIGQAVGSIPSQIQQAEALEQHRQLVTAQIADAQAQVKEREAIAAQRQRDAQAQAAGASAIKSAVGPDGKVDYMKAADSWEAAGFPVAANAYRESIQKTQKTALELTEAQKKIDDGKRQIQQASVNHFGELAAIGLDKLTTGDPLHARDTMMGLVANAASHGIVSEEDASKFLMQSAQAGPDQLKGLYQQLLDQAPAVKEQRLKDTLTQSEIAKNEAAAVKTPAAKSLQSKAVLIDGKPAEVSYNPADGSYQLGRQVVEPSRIKPVPTQASVTIQQGATDAKSIADAIVAGEQPPSVQGLYRLAGPVRAELAKQGYDMTKANLDWEATKKHLSTLNGAQQTRLRQAISTASDSLGVIEDLATQWDGGKFPLLNKANLILAKNGTLGPQAQQIATNLEAQITDVTSELGNVYMGGNSPTDHALSLAGKNLSADWTKDQLLSAIKLARTNLQIRGNSITNAGAVLSGGPQHSAPLVPTMRYNPATGKVEPVKPSGD